MCLVPSNSTLIMIGSVMVTMSTHLDSKGCSNGYVAWALSSNVLSIDRAPEAECLIMVEEANGSP